MKMKVAYYENYVRAFFRPSSTDEKVLEEVLNRRSYRKISIGFDVEAGEKWLDLGANIGAFAIYCKIRGATAVCYEPEPDCFSLLKRNVPEMICHNSAVSSSKSSQVDLWTSSIEGNHYRGTLLANTSMRTKERLSVKNVFAGDISEEFDGVKMDIEGSEFGLIDQGLIPACGKLCFEYHTSRDKSMQRLSERLAKLRGMFEVVSYVPSLDRMIDLGGEQKIFHDRVIYCMGKKKPSEQPPRALRKRG